MTTPLALDARARAEIEERRKQVSDWRIFSRFCALLWLDDGMGCDRNLMLIFPFNFDTLTPPLHPRFGSQAMSAALSQKVG